MRNLPSDPSSSSGAASGEEITEATSIRPQFSMRSLFSVSALLAALAGLGSQIPRNLESTHREAHLATSTSDLLITGPDTDKPGIFLTIKRSEEGETPSARLIDEYVTNACSPEARYLTRLSLNRLTNSDSDFSVLGNIERIGDLSISDCGQLTGAILAYIPHEIGSITFCNLPNFNGDALSMLGDKSIGSIIFTNMPVHDRDLEHLSKISGLKMVAFTGTDCSLGVIAQALRYTNVKMLTVKSRKSLDRTSEDVKLMEAWCKGRTQRTCLLMDETKSLILKNSASGLVETQENLSIFTSPSPSNF